MSVDLIIKFTYYLYTGTEFTCLHYLLVIRSWSYLQTMHLTSLFLACNHKLIKEKIFPFSLTIATLYFTRSYSRFSEIDLIPQNILFQFNALTNNFGI